MNYHVQETSDRCTDYGYKDCNEGKRQTQGGFRRAYQAKKIHVNWVLNAEKNWIEKTGLDECHSP